jgi:3',5'-cyclic AMP phosphodiesterase CpdA
MKRLAWVTDIHLNFSDDGDRISALCDKIAEARADALLVTGDIGEAESVGRYLRALRDRTGRPVYFVLGNHDYYGSSVVKVRQEMEQLTREEIDLHWMPSTGVVSVSESSALVGHDSWADGRLGDWEGSEVMLSDYFAIRDLCGLGKADLLARLNVLGDEAADFFREAVPRALERHRHVYVLTHVPPFRESCWYDGHISDDDWLPHFSCKAAGEVLAAEMKSHPEHQMTVLCGHTHGGGEARILPNLVVYTGGAVYGSPHLQRVLEVP